jgi:hypothetical protein
MRKLSMVLAVCTIVSSASSLTFATRISTVTATTTMGSGFGTSLTNTVNGVGLSSLSLTATHDGTTPANSWVSLAPATTGQVTFALGGSFPVDGFSFWNQNGGGPGANGSTGIQGVSILSSTNGSTFVPIPGAPTIFTQQPATTAVPPQFVTFPTVTATHIRFNILSNWGDAQTGFAEVGFNAVPEPAAGALLLVGVAGALSRRARCRRA